MEKCTHDIIFQKQKKNLFDQSVKNDMRTYYNIRKTGTGQRDDYTTVCLLDYDYSKRI